MKWLHGMRARLRLLARGSAEARMGEEMRFHLEMEADRLVRERGLDADEARRQAVIAFGGVEGHKEEVRAGRTLAWIEVWVRDIRYALRGLRMNPTFSSTLVLTLALGIGATAAMFSIIDALLLRPLPYHDPDRLVQVHATSPDGRWSRYLDWDAVRVWREQPAVFEGGFAHVRTSLLFTGGAEPQMLTAEGVTPDFEEVLGVRPVLGRGFYEQDAEPQAAPVVVLDHLFWRNAFAADPNILGRTIELEGQRHRIVGVMPEGFKFPEYATTELWLPLRRDGTLRDRPAGAKYFLGRIGKDPADVVQARADALARALSEEQPREQGWSIELRPLALSRAGGADLRLAVWFLAGAVALLLIVAAVNGSSLLLMRSWSRTRELAVRVALGASRHRILGQLLTESLLLALVSGVAATLLALIAIRGISGIIPGSITFFAPYAIEMEWRALAFTFVLATSTGMLIGLVPAILAARTGSAAAGAGLTPYAARTPERSRIRRGLIVGEVALSVMLLLGAGLLIHSFVRLVAVDPGFRTENLAVMKLDLSQASYPTSEARATFLRSLEERLEALPGVAGVAIADGIPPATSLSFGVTLEAEGLQPPTGGQPQLLPFANVPPDFFEVLEVPIAAGRAFTPEDAGTDHVIIDSALARFLWEDANPVGRRFRTGAEARWLTVVGVVPDLRLMGPDDRMGRFEILYPLGPGAAPAYVPLAIRTHVSPGSLLQSFRATVHEIDPRQPIQELRPARDLFAASIDMQRFLLVVMSILAGLALMLGAVGIYGVVAFGVIQRRRELGIRIALGAPLGRISRGVLREGLLLAGLGIIIGSAVALALSRVIQGLLYGVEPTDVATLVSVIVVSLAAAALACYLPARRAARVDPVEVLRAE